MILNPNFWHFYWNIGPSGVGYKIVKDLDLETTSAFKIDIFNLNDG